MRESIHFQCYAYFVTKSPVLSTTSSFFQSVVMVWWGHTVTFLIAVCVCCLPLSVTKRAFVVWCYGLWLFGLQHTKTANTLFFFCSRRKRRRTWNEHEFKKNTWSDELNKRRANTRRWSIVGQPGQICILSQGTLPQYPKKSPGKNIHQHPSLESGRTIKIIEDQQDQGLISGPTKYTKPCDGVQN